MTKYQFSLALLTSVFSVMSFSSSLQAACVTGDCAAMGYTKTESACSGDIIRCPFDTSKVFCKEVQIENGSILYSDKTTSKEKISGKTPIGIVFDGQNRLAIALTEFKKIKWSSEGRNDIPGLKNYTSASDISDYNGKSNTKIIIDQCGSKCEAAYKAYNYSTEGTSVGQWYLPSAGEMAKIYELNGLLNDALRKVSGTRVFGNYPGDNISYWTSTESSKEFAKATEPFYGKMDSDIKSNPTTTIGGYPMVVRPVIQF